MRGRKPQKLGNAQFPFTLSARVNGEEFRLYKDHAAQMGLLTSHWIRIAIANQHNNDLATINPEKSTISDIPVQKPMLLMITAHKKEQEDIATVFSFGVGICLLLFSKNI
jgi:regulation of enolase protein 1 (concanavalin A-like superfamily)